MAKSLKSLLSKINLVDVAVVLVLIAVLMCLMKKMNVVEGLCVANDRGNASAIKRCEGYAEESACNIDICQWVSEDLVEIEQMQPEGLRRALRRRPRLEIPDVEQVGDCIVNYRDISGFQKSDYNNTRMPLVTTCSENADNDCESIGYSYMLRGACCIEDPNDPGECM